MRNMKQVALAVSVFFFVLSAASVRATDKVSGPVSINTMTPGQMRLVHFDQSANVRLVVAVEKDEGNRSLDISCDSNEGLFVRSEKPLEGRKVEGQNERTVFDLGFDLLLATYRCQAILERVVDGKKKEFTSSVEVIVR